MSVKYKFGNQDKLYFVTFAVVNWIDPNWREYVAQAKEGWGTRDDSPTADS